MLASEYSTSVVTCEVGCQTNTWQAVFLRFVSSHDKEKPEPFNPLKTPFPYTVTCSLSHIGLVDRYHQNSIWITQSYYVRQILLKGEKNALTWWAQQPPKGHNKTNRCSVVNAQVASLLPCLSDCSGCCFWWSVNVEWLHWSDNEQFFSGRFRELFGVTASLSLTKAVEFVHSRTYLVTVTVLQCGTFMWEESTCHRRFVVPLLAWLKTFQGYVEVVVGICWSSTIFLWQYSVFLICVNVILSLNVKIVRGINHIDNATLTSPAIKYNCFSVCCRKITNW